MVIGIGVGINAIGSAASYRRVVLGTQPGALIAYWPMDDASGTTMRDAAPLGRNGTYSGTAVLGAEGAAVTGVSFGANAYVTLPASVGTAFNGASGTVAQWVRVPSYGVWQDATIRRSVLIQADTNNRIILYKDSANTNTIGANYVAGAVVKTLTQAQVPATWGGYIHVALTWSKAQDRVRLYINGAQAGADATGLGTWAGTPSTLFIGASSTVPAQPWSGLIDETALWSAELSASEIAALAAPPELSRSLLVFEGDSRTVGTGATAATNYPVQAGTSLAGNWRFANVAGSGETLATMITQVSAQVAPLYSASYRRNVCVVWGGVNDNTDAATMHTRLSTLCAAIRALGYRVVVCTEIDCQSAAHTAWHATEYQALNTLIRANYTTYADALADLGARSELQDATNTTYYNADKTHLTSAGYGVVSAVVTTAIG